MGKIIRNGIEFSSTVDTANNISYNNSLSGLKATTTQKAIDELADSLVEQPTFVYDENGQITGYTTKIGGADTVFPFKSLSFSSCELGTTVNRGNACSVTSVFDKGTYTVLVMALITGSNTSKASPDVANVSHHRELVVNNATVIKQIKMCEETHTYLVTFKVENDSTSVEFKFTSGTVNTGFLSRAVLFR